MIARLAVLTAAEVLRTFTIPELAAHTGVPRKTVTSILRRDEAFFGKVTDGTAETKTSAPQGRGRPATLWEVTDAEALHAYLASVPRRPETNDREAGPDIAGATETYLFDAVTIAERKYIAACEATAAGRQRTVLLRTVRAAVAPVIQELKDMELADWAKSLQRRALLVDAMAKDGLDEPDGTSGPLDDEVERLWLLSTNFGEAVSDLPNSVLRSYWRTVALRAEEIHHLPPVRFVTRPWESIEEVYPELSKVDWERKQIDALCSWTPTWASALERAGLVFTVMYERKPGLSPDLFTSPWLHDADAESFRPLLVATDCDDEDLRAASESGFQLFKKDWGLSSVLNACHSRIAMGVARDLIIEPKAITSATPKMVRKTTGRPLKSQRQPKIPSLPTGAEATRSTGTVRWVNKAGGYGLVSIAPGVDVVFDVDVVSDQDASSLDKQDRVNVETHGLMATRIWTEDADA